ncbi:hypothetical protein LCGC14_0791020 [marine sediment metagenome]|uniref:Uncharacterized protein n=1 Tax=marine sediment metagenome TaxID=412755 RepID=A0A0F9PSP4_9ZZZZ
MFKMLRTNIGKVLDGLGFYSLCTYCDDPIYTFQTQKKHMHEGCAQLKEEEATT